ncbi:MAG: hypothetical protein LBP52_06660 [Burkholderiaceae bacterium]|jgi:hypothetical protein|nr:hypothetical protein [Burkholderiaceae bacterium]
MTRHRDACKRLAKFAQQNRGLTMGVILSPMVSEFDTIDQEANHTARLRGKVEASLADPRPAIPHAEVMAELDALIDRIEAEAR